jgi:hypothetical protein
MISGVWVIGFKTSIGSKEEIKEKDANRRWKAYQQHKNIEKWVDHRSDGSKKVSLNLLSGAFKLQLCRRLQHEHMNFICQTTDWQIA